jgi:peptide/nickel transport system substrate-binding protein
MEALNQAVFGGAAQVAHIMYPSTSPFHVAQPELYAHDRDRAQHLFDELAAEGKPVRFTILTYPSDAQRVVEAVQAQLRSYREVAVEIEIRDAPDVWARLGAGEFQASPWVIPGDDPEPNLFSAMSSTSKRNYTGIDDPALDAALLAGRNATTDAERVAAYTTAQQRITELVPFVPYERWSPGLIMSDSVGGASFYGIAAPVIDTLWLAQDSP